jgi:hypothetical protein
MFDHRTQFDLPPGNALSAESDADQQESICCLQYMVAFLLEKNEQIRGELAARNFDARPQASPFDA